MKNYKYATQYNSINENTGIEVRDLDEFFDFEKKLLNKSNLSNFNKIEAWTALGSNIQVNYSTHGLFRYFGKFPSPIATHLISQFTEIGDIVIDPMCGSGTTGVESYLLQRKCFCFDVNPLSILLGKVKTTKIDKDILCNDLQFIIENYKPLTVDEYNWDMVGLKDANHWFLEETQKSIRGLIKVINDLENNDSKNFFLVCLYASIRSISKATSQQGRLFLDVLTAKEDGLETFCKKAKKGIEAIDSLPAKTFDVLFEHHSVFDEFSCSKSKLIIVHPPYFNSYKYSSINSLELSWMNVNHADVRKQEVHEFFKIGKAENCSKYVSDMTLALKNIEKITEVNGKIALMIGDTIIKGDYIDVTKRVIDSFLSSNKNMEVEKVVLRVPKYTEASWTASQRRKADDVGINLCDFIVIFNKKYEC